jgi:3-phenylpropionate/trans-cinnamate dioxygenase ferredoxin subunit
VPGNADRDERRRRAWSWSREGEIVRCPWHGFEFDIATGRSITDPPLQARTFAVTVEDGLVVVDLDARA